MDYYKKYLKDLETIKNSNATPIEIACDYAFLLNSAKTRCAFGDISKEQCEQLRIAVHHRLHKFNSLE